MTAKVGGLRGGGGGAGDAANAALFLDFPRSPPDNTGQHRGLSCTTNKHYQQRRPWDSAPLQTIDLIVYPKEGRGRTDQGAEFRLEDGEEGGWVKRSEERANREKGIGTRLKVNSLLARGAINVHPEETGCDEEEPVEAILQLFVALPAVAKLPDPNLYFFRREQKPRKRTKKRPVLGRVKTLRAGKCCANSSLY